MPDLGPLLYLHSVLGHVWKVMAARPLPVNYEHVGGQSFGRLHLLVYPETNEKVVKSILLDFENWGTYPRAYSSSRIAVV